MPAFGPVAGAALVLAPVRATVGGALVLAPGRGDIWGAFVWAAFVRAAARGAPGGRFVLTPGRSASAWFVFATTRGATVAALVPKGFPI